MISFLKELWSYLQLVWKSKFKYMLLLFALWLYRIDFMPDTGGGMAKVVQIVALVGLFYMMKKYRSGILGYSFTHTNTATKSCLLLYVYGVISALWAFMPSMAFFMAFQNVVMLMLMVWYFSMFRDFRSMERGFIVFTLSMVLFESICSRIWNPSLMIHFLGGASSSALCFVYSSSEWMRAQDEKRKHFLKYAMILSFVLMVTSTSSGANASALFGFALACLFAGKVLWAALIMGGTLFLLLNQDMITEIILTLNPGKTMEMIESGNGRETIWAALMENAKQRPILGWGFACIERTASDVLPGQILSDAHNNYIGMYGSLGIVGLTLFVFHLIFSAFTAFKNKMKPGYLGLFTAIAAAAVNGYSYGFLSGKGCSITVVYFALIVLTYFYRKSPYRIIKQENGQIIK